MGNPATLSYDSYSQDRYDLEEAVNVEPSETRGVRVTVGLSPFDIPDAVSLEIVPPDTVVFHFRYPTDEYAELGVRQSCLDDSIQFVLGRHTRRVIQVVLRDAFRRLSEGPVTFDPSVAQQWVGGLNAQAHNVCLRNAVVIAKILEFMPPKLRKEALALLRT